MIKNIVNKYYFFGTVTSTKEMLFSPRHTEPLYTHYVLIGGNFKFIKYTMFGKFTFRFEYSKGW